jgi:hypothetical protein
MTSINITLVVININIILNIALENLHRNNIFLQGYLDPTFINIFLLRTSGPLHQITE